MEKDSSGSAFFAILLGLVAIGGYVANLYKLIGAASHNDGFEFVVRIFGFAVPPVGAVFGFF